MRYGAEYAKDWIKCAWCYTLRPIKELSSEGDCSDETWCRQQAIERSDAFKRGEDAVRAPDVDASGARRGGKGGRVRR
jgi:hypothetical protein